MKTLILSDIHGSASSLDRVLEYFHSHQFDMLIILGDILNYGPRNGLPEGLNAPLVAERLNALADRIIAVRGNCDSEVDQMLLKFPIMSDYALLVLNGKRIFLTHGHKYSKDQLPTLAVDVLFQGHTHMQELSVYDGKIVCNTGSITFPKGDNPPTFATIDEQGTIRIHTLDGTIMKEMRIDHNS